MYLYIVYILSAIYYLEHRDSSGPLPPNAGGGKIQSSCVSAAARDHYTYDKYKSLAPPAAEAKHNTPTMSTMRRWRVRVITSQPDRPAASDLRVIA